ncbi:hypothetical protein KBA63_01820 [Candidatus Woesebacteria bacterium]|jgi:large subunit ribosomal protein L1|nr:hypothetical protein [Candidatus Woesebacteria bacterium]MBP9687456.1 hypothetical protein [Candidatus Woesebacteria bacterium]
MENTKNTPATPKKNTLGHRGKQYKAVKAKVDSSRVYNATDAIALVKETSYAKFDASIEFHAVIRRETLNVQVALPHSTGKTKKVVLVTPEVIAELEAGKVTFDVILATPETMPKLVKFAKLLGPRGLMPNPKNGTLVKEASAIDKFSTDTISVKTEKKAPVIHVALGKVSMDSEKLAENLAAVIAAINPKIIVKAYLTSSMGPSVKLQAA